MHISKEKMAVIKSMVGTVYQTIQRLNENEQMLKLSMSKVINITSFNIGRF